MISLEAYNSYLRKVNRNDTNRNIKIPKGQFVSLYNEQAEIWLSDFIRDNNSTDKINEISELLQLDISLEKSQDTLNSSDFNIPEDYFEYSSAYCLAQKEGCSESVVYCWDIKNKNKNTLFQNENEKPSFEYQETFIQHNQDKIKVYRDNFDISKLYLDYYRVPKKIDIEGYINVDGTNSSNINPDISDFLVNKIIEYCVVETIRVFQSPEAFQLAKDRILSNK